MNYEKYPEFDNHSKLIAIKNKRNAIIGYIAIHRGTKHLPAFGATRYAYYSDHEHAIRDALKLSRLMSYKSAAAHLPYGGAKGVLIAKENTLKASNQLLKEYAAAVNALEGAFITGADLGISAAQVLYMSQFSPYFAGTRVNPVYFTVSGIILGLKAALAECFDSGAFHKRSFAIQGVGKIGAGVLQELYARNAKIYFTDTNQKLAKKIHKQFPKIIYVPPSEIHSQKVDVFCPCAVAGSINEQSVNKLRCAIVAGGAAPVVFREGRAGAFQFLGHDRC